MLSKTKYRLKGVQIEKPAADWENPEEEAKLWTETLRLVAKGIKYLL